MYAMFSAVPSFGLHRDLSSLARVVCAQIVFLIDSKY